MPLMAAITAPLRPKSRDLLYMANQSLSVSSGLSPINIGAKQFSIAAAAISGTSSP